MSGHGAGAHGGRWNPRGLTAIYASLDPVTATKESYYELLQAGLPATVIRPRVMVGLAIDLKQVLDLTDGRIRRSFGLTLADLIEEDWSAIQLSGEEPWTQAIGRGAAEAGFEGILVPSARQLRGKNAVIFPGNLRRGSTVEAMAKEDLPPHPKEWPG